MRLGLPEMIGDSIIREVVTIIWQGFVLGAAFVYIGWRIAPSHKPTVSIVLGALSLLIAGLLLFPALVLLDWRAMLEIVCLLLGSMSATVSAFRGEGTFAMPAARADGAEAACQTTEPRERAADLHFRQQEEERERLEAESRRLERAWSDYYAWKEERKRQEAESQRQEQDRQKREANPLDTKKAPTDSNHGNSVRENAGYDAAARNSDETNRVDPKRVSCHYDRGGQQLKDEIRGRQARYRRRVHWIRMTSLPPPDDRAFTPRTEGDERPGRIDPGYEREKQQLKSQAMLEEQGYVEPYPRKPKWSLPATADDTPPSWHNVVRAMEEDR
jgi:hypothetical protein